MLYTQQLVWPKRGINETLAHVDQSPEYSFDEKNARTQDPVDKRMRGAQRAGTSKFVAGTTGTGKVQDLGIVTRHQPAVTYGLAVSERWKEHTPTSSACRDVATDDQGNIYALDGNSGWAKYSSDGERIITVPAPLSDKMGILRSIHVDSLRNVYVSVGEGGDQRESCIWAWRPDLDEEGEVVYYLRWTIKPEAFVGDLSVHNNLLYTVQNDDIKGISAVITYELIYTAAPQIERAYSIQYPVRGFTVQTSGAVVVCSPTNADRLLSKTTPGGTQVLQGTLLEDLEDNGDIKIWSDYRPAQTALSDIVGTSEIPRVAAGRDVSRNGTARHLYTNRAEGLEPIYDPEGPLNGTPAWYFEGENILSSRVNPSVAKANASSQRSMVPSYEDAQYCVFMVVSPISEDQNGCLLAQKQANTLGKTDGEARDFGVHFNRKASDSVSGVTADKDFVSIRDESVTDLWLGLGANPLEQDFANMSHSLAPAGAVLTPQAGLLTFFCDGNLNKGLGNVRSLFRWNGCPVDRATSRPLESLEATHLGSDPNNINLLSFKGWVHRIVVLDRLDLDDDSLGCFSDHKTGLAYQYPDVAFSGTSDTIMEKVEAILLREHGLGHLLDGGNSLRQYSLGNGGVDSTFIHPYGDGNTALHQSETPWSGSAAADPNQFRTTNSLVTKYDGTSNNVVWIYKDPLTGGNNRSGYGLVSWPNSPNALGQEDLSSVGPDGWQYLRDTGLAVSSIAQNDFSAATPLENQYCRMFVDEQNNTYIPFYSTGAIGSAFSVEVVDGGGVTEFDYRNAGSANDSQGAFAVVGPAKSPDYNQAGINRGPLMAVGYDTVSFDAVTSSLQGLALVDVISSIPLSNVPRITEILAVNDGNIKKSSLGSSNWVAITGGTGALGATSSYINATTVFGKRYFTDGDKYAVYDPNEGSSGEIIAWKATKGTIPPRMRVITNYRGRIVLFGDPEEGTNWQMSAKDDPLNWDTAPPRRTPSQAISGSSPDLTGRIPGVINAFIPISDDVAVIGTDNSIFLLRGDPLANGQIDLISKQYGIAFGKAWTQDPDGRVYAMLTTGDIVQIAGTGEIVNLSENAIENRLENINLGTHYAEMVWDWRDNGLRLMIMPYAQSSSPSKPEHYFWEQRLQAWHPDTFTAQGHQPTAISLMDGDEADDRRVIYGAEDGFVRVFDQSALSDDGERIDFYVVGGPMAPESAQEDSTFRFMGFNILLSRSHQGGHLGLCATEDPANLVFDYYTLDAGRTVRAERMVGSYCFWRIGNGQLSQRLAFEEGSYKWARAGRKRAYFG